MTIYREFDDENIDYVDLRAVVRSILVARSQFGATIQEIKDDYRKFLACEFPYVESMTEFLLTIPEIICYTDQNGTRIFNLQSSGKSKHILEMVKNQKPSKNTQMTRSNQNLEYEMDHAKERLISTPENVCFFEDNYRYLNICNNKRRSSLTSHTISPSAKSGYDSCFSENEYNAHLYDYQLLGDDFFLSMAKMELKCRFTPGHKILRSGLCISGQTIKGATKRVLTAPYLNKNIIINIGSVDILHGRELIDIQHDFLNLMSACDLRGVQPIVTTLVPLANLAHHPPTRNILKKFNEFIKTHCHKWKVIDLWHCMVNEHDHILFECYQKMDCDISNRYRRKINDFCDGLDPYKLETKRCKDALPSNVGYFDVANYLINGESSYTKEAFRSYRSLEAYKFYQNTLKFLSSINCRSQICC